ncbi:MAG: hypothetical protein GX879_00700 [Bacteroidales bacterium]|nr:hypothetical protein [Bacteroidales bacterium]
MKKTTIILSLTLIIFTNASAQTVALNRDGNTQIFKGINALVEANNVAEDGDTLYLSGHNFNPTTNFTKSLKIYGVGHMEVATTATGKTYINGNINLREGTDNFYIEGVDFENLSVENNKSVKNLTIKRCNIRSSISFPGSENPSEDFIISGSIIRGSINLSNTERTLINNNILTSYITNSTENIFKNNVFIMSNVNSTIGGNNNFLANNFFWNINYSDRICSGDGNLFYNNAFTRLETGINFGTNPLKLNNFFDIDAHSFFVNKEGNSFNIEDDLHLTEPENYIGEDNTEIGIYGGMYPYKINAIPIIPHIESVNVPHHVDEDGNLPVQIKVKAQNEQD